MVEGPDGERETSAHVETVDGRTEIEVNSPGAFEKAKSLIEISDLDKDDIEHVQIIMDTKSPDERETEEVEEEESEEVEEDIESQLTKSDISILELLDEKGRFFQTKEIYNHVEKRYDIKDSTARGRLRDLADKGFVEKRPYPEDKRKRQYKITSKGERALEKVEGE